MSQGTDPAVAVADADDRSLLLMAFDGAMLRARDLVRVVHDEDATWAPHPRALPLGTLAAHIVDIPGWTAGMLRADGYDVGASRPPTARWEGAPAACAAFDMRVADARALLQRAAPDVLAATWRLRNGSHVLCTLTRAQAVSLFVVNHVVHHTAQLELFLVMRGTLPRRAPAVVPVAHCAGEQLPDPRVGPEGCSLRWGAKDGRIPSP